MASMASLMLYPVILVFRYSLQPFTPLTWLGYSTSTLDVLGTFRICLLLRQIREQLHGAHVNAHGHKDVEPTSSVKNLAATMTAMFGGEALIAPLLGSTPSFMLSGGFAALSGVVQGLIDSLPKVPKISASLEVPFAILDAFTRTSFLCNFILPVVVSHASLNIANSPWALLVSSMVIANGGFLLMNMFSLLHPTPWAVRTPPEMQAYGWTSADLWCAPAITGLYALLTHAQPFWTDLHITLLELLGTPFDKSIKGSPDPLDPETARAFCTLLLVGLFLGRALKNFGFLKKSRIIANLLHTNATTEDRPKLE